MAEPMITIKKADGTFAKVPLSEFKKIQASPASLPSANPSGSVAPADSAGKQQKPAEPVKPASAAATHVASLQKSASAPHHQAAHHPAKHHAPVHVKSHTEHAKPAHHTAPHHPKQMSRADAGSLLEEKLKIKTSAPLFSPKREKQVEEVLEKLGFTVVPDVLGRLKSLILARLKDIKSEDETKELLARSIKNGGLGLTETQVEKIIKSCQEVESLENGNSFSSALHSLESELELPAPTVMVKSEPIKQPQVMEKSPPKHQFTPTVPVNVTTTKESVISTLVNKSLSSEPVFKLDSKPVMKQSMQDVTASSVEMGPVEEIKSISLTDFRRLSGNPEEAAKRIAQKMFNLQDESFVWYLEALAAYHVSPLYSEYMQAICQSLAERKSLANVLSMKNSIKLNEVMALVEMERSL